VKGRDPPLLENATAYMKALDETFQECAAKFGFDLADQPSLSDALDAFEPEAATGDDFSHDEVRRAFIRALELRRALPDLLAAGKLDLAVATTSRYAFAVGCLAERLLRRDGHERLVDLEARPTKAREDAKRAASAPRARKSDGKIVTDEQLLQFKAAWLAQRGRARGWQTAAAIHFGMTEGAISKRMEK